MFLQCDHHPFTFIFLLLSPVVDECRAGCSSPHPARHCSHRYCNPSLFPLYSSSSSSPPAPSSPPHSVRPSPPPPSLCRPIFHCCHSSQEVACVTIASIVVRNPAAKAQVAAAGGLEACIDALYAHAENPGVQEAGCKALANTVANCSAGLEDRAAAAGGVNAVLASLTNHHEAGYVVEAACAALANLTANSAAVRRPPHQRSRHHAPRAHR